MGKKAEKSTKLEPEFKGIEEFNSEGGSGPPASRILKQDTDKAYGSPISSDLKYDLETDKTI